MAFDPSTAQAVMAFDPSTAKEFNEQSIQPSEQPNSALSSIANSPVVTGINAIGGGAQSAIANSIGTAIGSPKTTEVLSPPAHVQEAMSSDPTLSLTGKILGYGGAAAAATGAATAGATALFGEGLLSNLGANAVAGSILAGPNNRLLGAGIGGATAAIAPAISSTANYLAKAATLGTRLKGAVSAINDTIQGTPDQVAAKSQANMWNSTDALDKQNFSFIKSANDITTVPENAAKQAQLILDKYKDPKVLGDLNGTQRQIVQQIADWSKQESKSIPASSILNSSGSPLSGQTNQIINSNTKFSLKDLHEARKGLDQAISQAFNQSDNGAISKGIASDLLSIRAPMEQDLLSAASKAGVKDQYLNSNAFYKSNVLPLINSGAKDTAEAIKNSDKDPLVAGKITDGLINKYIKPNKPEIAKSFLNTLDSVGRQAVEVQVVNNALKKATNNIDKIDPLVFKTNIQNVQKQLGSVFSENTNNMLNGLNKAIDQGTKILGMTLDTSKIQTGYKIGAAASALGTIGYTAGTGAAGTVGAIALGLHSLLQSKMGQQLLIRAGTRGGEEVGKQIVNGLLIQGALAATPPDLKN